MGSKREVLLLALKCKLLNYQRITELEPESEAAKKVGSVSEKAANSSCTASKTMGTYVSMAPRNWICPQDASLGGHSPEENLVSALQDVSRDPGPAMLGFWRAELELTNAGYFKPPHYGNSQWSNRKLTHWCSSRHWVSMVKSIFQMFSLRWQRTVFLLLKNQGREKGEKVKKQPRFQSK